MGDEVASRYCIVHLLCCRNGAFASLVREIDGNIPSLARDLASAIMHCAHAVDKSVCSARVERLHEPLRDVPIWLPAGDPRKAFRHLESALRNARSATGASVGLSVEKLFAFPVEKCLRRSWERRWTGPQDFSRLAKEPGKRRCGMRHDGASRNCGQWIHPWRRRACFRRSPRTFLKSRKTQYSWASWRRKGSPGDIFTGIPFRGFPVEKLLANCAGSGPPGLPRDSAEPWLGRERSFCRVPPNGCRYLVDKAVGKVLEKMPCQVAPMACRVGCFLSSADVAKIAGTVGAGGFPRSRMGSRHAVDNSVSKVVMTVLRQMLTRVRRRVARKCAAASQACSGLVPLGAAAWPVAPGASRVPGLS